MLGERFAVALQDAQGGDEVAFAMLFRDLQPALVRYLKVVAASAAEIVAGVTRFQKVADGSRRVNS